MEQDAPDSLAPTKAKVGVDYDALDKEIELQRTAALKVSRNLCFSLCSALVRVLKECSSSSSSSSSSPPFSARFTVKLGSVFHESR